MAPALVSEMRAFARRAALLCLALTLPLLAQDAPAPAAPAPAAPAPSAPVIPAIPVVTFAFDRPGLPVPDFILSIGGPNGQYAGQEVPPTARPTDPAPAPQPFGRSFEISPATARKIFTLAHELNDFNIACASKAKNIADTGKKRLTYAGPDGSGSCTYNYTENKSVQALTEVFQGIATTLDTGRHLDYLHRYDHLGLDAALESFAHEVSEGRCLEVGTIAPTLRSLASDPALMQRVRTRAAALLAKVPSSQ